VIVGVVLACRNPICTATDLALLGPYEEVADQVAGGRPCGEQSVVLQETAKVVDVTARSVVGEWYCAWVRSDRGRRPGRLSVPGLVVMRELGVGQQYLDFCKPDRPDKDGNSVQLALLTRA
jgi:hypothetical protein